MMWLWLGDEWDCKSCDPVLRYLTDTNKEKQRDHVNQARLRPKGPKNSFEIDATEAMW